MAVGDAEQGKSTRHNEPWPKSNRHLYWSGFAALSDYER